MGWVDAECHVCARDRRLQLYAAPFAPVSIAWKCDECAGIASLDEVALLLGMAQRHFERRQRYLVPTLLLPVLIDGEVVPVARALLSEPVPKALANYTWTRPAGRRMEQLLAARVPLDVIDRNEIAALGRAGLDRRRGA